MFVTIASHKGGVGKTTTAVHIAAFFASIGSTLLIDGDPNRSATEWGASGHLPFTIVDVAEGAYQARNFEHVVIDTEARPGEVDLENLAKGCDLLIIPAVPATLDAKATAKTLQSLRRYITPDKYRVLITKAPPAPQDDAQTFRSDLVAAGIPIFDTDIPALKAFEHAVAAGVIVSEAHHHGRAKLADTRRAWQAYEAIGRSIIPVTLHQEPLHAAAI